MSDATRAEICAVAIADTFAGDGEILISPIGNLPQIGGRLAKLTCCPDALMTDGVAPLVPPNCVYAVLLEDVAARVQS